MKTLPLIVLAALTMASCSKKTASSAASSSATASVATRVLTDDEIVQAETFGRKMVDLMNEGKKDLVVSCFDEAALKGLVFENMGVSARNSQEFMGGVMKSVFQAMMIEGNTFRFMRAGNFNGRPMFLIRMISSEGACNYFEMLINPDEAPDYRVKDLHSATTGLMSDQLRMTASLVFKEPGALISALGGSKTVNPANSQKLQNFFTVSQSGDAKKAKQEYDALPDELRKQWSIAMNFLNSQMNAGSEEEYRAALAQLAKDFEGHKDAQMTFVDHYFFEEKYDKAQATIESLIKRYGDDGNLLVMLSNVKQLAGDEKGSRAALDKACEVEPDFASAWDMRGTRAVVEKDYAMAVSCYERFEEAASMILNLDELAELDESFAAFSQSAEFQEWAKRRAEQEEEMEE